MTNHFQTIANNQRKSFTLIELLVVLALVAILSVVVILTLNPAELIKQARDSNRLNDLATINTALNLFSADVTGGFMGTSTIVYISIPSTTSTCSNLGLPTLPSGYTYNCVAATSTRNTDGTGWIPVNFQRISSNSPISQLPVDPQNTTSTKYYTYVTGGSWKVIATPESQKYTATASIDGGSNIGQFEVGNNMSLAPFIDGLVGWWKFDEGSGTTATDSSGYGNSGTLTSGPSWSSACGYSDYCLNFDGVTDDYVNILSYATSSGGITFSARVSWDGTVRNSYSGIVASANGMVGRILIGAGGAILIQNGNGNYFSTRNLSANQWSNVIYSYDKVEGLEYIYINGLAAGRQSRSISLQSGADISIGRGLAGASTYSYGGLIDDFRVYNRALSAAEILALYNATK